MKMFPILTFVSLLIALAFTAHLTGKGDAFFQWFTEKVLLPGRAAEHLAHFHVFHIAGAEAVAVHQQYWLVSQGNHGRVIQQSGAGLCAEGLSQQEIAVAVHEKQAGA